VQVVLPFNREVNDKPQKVNLLCKLDIIVKTVRLSQITDLTNLEQRTRLDNISDEKISNYSSDPGHMQCF